MVNKQSGSEEKMWLQQHIRAALLQKTGTALNHTNSVLTEQLTHNDTASIKFTNFNTFGHKLN